MRNKANPGLGALGLRIVDFGLVRQVGLRTRPTSRIERPGADERICETKPICSGQAGGGRPQGIAQAAVQNKANWGAGDRDRMPSPRTPYGVTTSASHSTKQSQFGLVQSRPDRGNTIANHPDTRRWRRSCRGRLVRACRRRPAFDSRARCPRHVVPAFEPCPNLYGCLNGSPLEKRSYA